MRKRNVDTKIDPKKHFGELDVVFFMICLFQEKCDPLSSFQ